MWLNVNSLDFYFPQVFYSDEKAMKFIQLERLYHEQLLANLSAIQEQWGEYRLAECGIISNLTSCYLRS